MDDHATTTDRLAGVLWTRDQFATYWPCAVASVPTLAKRHGIPRAGIDDDTSQATYRAVDVVTAYGSRSGQGARTDIRDASLAGPGNKREHRDYYQLGRAIGAAGIVTDLYSPYRESRNATDRIQERGGRLTMPLLKMLHEELRHTAERTSPEPDLEQRARDAFEQLLPTVLDLIGQNPSLEQQNQFFIGYHHQRGALWDAAGVDPEHLS